MKKDTFEEERKRVKNLDLENIVGDKLLLAIRENNLSDYYLNEFLKKKNDYSDELPEQDVRDLIGPTENFSQYKCQGNYIIGLNTALDGAIFRKVITDPNLINKIKKVSSHDFEMNYGRFTSKKEIEMMNNILDKVINYLQGKE